MTIPRRLSPVSARALTLGLALGMLAACDSGWDRDFRTLGGSSDALRVETGPRPEPDSRGVISYPSYQVAVARSGDTVGDVASRVGLGADELARFNGLPPAAQLRQGEVVALPRRVAEPSLATGAGTTGPIRPAGEIDITRLAGDAIDRVEPQDTPARTAPTISPAGTEPVRHKVERGETAYSIARLYNVTVRSLASWNGLGPELTVREDQFLLIPVPARQAAATPPRTPAAPGQHSTAPTPPSAAKPLPAEETRKPAATPPSPKMAQDSSTKARFEMPVSGSVIRGYEKGKNDGIDISGKAGSPVQAAADGTVAAITRDTDQVPILVIRHTDNMLSVYANIDGIVVEKGDTVRRGQRVATLRAGDPAFLHFELRKGFESVDPIPYLTP